MDLKNQILDYGRRAREAARALARLKTEQKNAALCAMAKEIVARTAAILSANENDLAKARTSGLSAAMIDRLVLDGSRIAAMAESIQQVAALTDPVGEVIRE